MLYLCSGPIYFYHLSGHSKGALSPGSLENVSIESLQRILELHIVRMCSVSVLCVHTMNLKTVLGVLWKIFFKWTRLQKIETGEEWRQGPLYDFLSSAGIIPECRSRGPI